MYLPLAVRVGFLTAVTLCPAPLYWGFGKVGCAWMCLWGCLPTTTLNWATRHNVYFSLFKKVFWSPEWFSKLKNSHCDRGERIFMFLNFCFPCGFKAIYIPLQLLPLLGSSTLWTVLPLEDLVEDFMRGSWCHFSPGCGIIAHKMLLLEIVQSCCLFLVSTQPCLCTLL